MRKYYLISIGVAGVIVLVAVLTLIGLRQQRRIFALLPTSTTVAPAPTAAAPTQVTQPVAVPAATARAGTPTPSTAQVAATMPAPTPTSRSVEPETALFYDDFSRTTSGWAPFYLDAEANFNGYSAGTYTLRAATNQILYDVPGALTFVPRRYAIDIRYQAGQGSFGMLIGVRGDPNDFRSLSYYAVGLTSSGQVFISRQAAGGAIETLAQRNLPGLAVAHQVRLAVDVGDSGIAVFVNDEAALNVLGSTAPSSALGLFALPDAIPLSVSFDNLIATGQLPGEQLACAALRPLFVQPGEEIRGADVALVRERLVHLGYLPEGGAESYDAALMAAVTQFQQHSGLDADGVVGATTWCSLLSSASATAQTGQPEIDAAAGQMRPVALDPQVPRSAPMLVSIRQIDASWRIAIILPGDGAPLYLETEGDAFDPALSPDHRLLAFSRSQGDANSIWLLDTINGTVREVSPPQVDARFPAWSPDGRTLLYTVDAAAGSPNARIYLHDIASGRAWKLSDEHGGWADWSVNNEIVFTRLTDQGFDLFRCNLDGSGMTNLTNTEDRDEDIAAWSPDGTRIAFVVNPRDQPNDRQIFTMLRDGTDVRQLTTMPGPNSNPTWFPDGQTLLFANQPSEDVRQPWLLSADGAIIVRLSDNQDRIWFMAPVSFRE